VHAWCLTPACLDSEFKEITCFHGEDFPSSVQDKLSCAGLAGIVLLGAFGNVVERSSSGRVRLNAVGDAHSGFHALILFDGRLVARHSGEESGPIAPAVRRLRWSKIAQMLGTSVTAVRASLWRDVRKARLRLLGMYGTHRGWLATNDKPQT
jgi:hypothetical protein